MPPPKKRFGANVRRIRDASGLTQMQLANACSMDPAEISRIERGERDPRLSTIVRVAHGLKIPPRDLLEGF